MHPKERPSPTRSPTPETEWSRDFANSYYHGRPPHPISPPPKRRVFDLNDEELNRSKYEQKRALYMRKYRGNFDENKLPQYLRSFEAFMVGREEYLRNRMNNNNNNNNRPTFRHRDTRETSSPQSSERDEQEFTGRPLITLHRQSSPFNRFERRFQRENVSRSRSQSRSPSLSSVPRFRSFSRSRSRSPPAIRYSRPAAALRSPTRSWSRSPCRLISFRSSSRQNGVQARSGPRTPSTSPPPSRERSHDSFYSQRGQPPKVRSRTPLNSPPSFVPQSRSQSRSPPRHREKRPLERPSGSPGQMHRTDSQPPHLLLPGLVDIGGEPIAGSSRSFLQHQSPVVASVKPEIRIILKQSPNGAQPSHHQQHIQYQSHLVQSPVYANPQILAYPETVTLAPQLPQLPPQQSPHVIEQYQTATTPHPPQSGYKRNTELPPIPGAVPLDVEDETDDASSMISDFHKLPNRPYFVKGEHNIYFTPCLATFYENIRLAWKELIYPPRFFDVITSYTDSRRMKLARALEATIVLAVGQSCALSYNLTTEKKSVVAEQLLKAELPVLRAFRMIASQYGSVKCEQTGDFLKPIDHTGDIRAIVRMASHLLPERETEAQCENGQPDKELTILSDEEGSNVATRSWLPTYNADKRFFWIFALKVKEFMHSRLGIFSQPMETVQELAAPRKTIPRWWTIFRDQLPGEASGRFDFLWHDWNETTFYENLGSHPAGAMALQAIGLTWPTPEQSHLNFNINLREEIPRIYRYIFQDLELYLTNFKLMVMQQLGPAHYGSWNQLASVINFMGWNVFKNCRETDKATQNLALRFPPRVYHDMEL